MGAGAFSCIGYMVPEVVYLVATMTVLSTVSVGVARYELDVPTTACWSAVLPTMVVGTVATRWVRATLELHFFAVPLDVGVMVLVLALTTLIFD